MSKINFLILLCFFQATIQHYTKFSYTDEIITLALGMILLYGLAKKIYLPSKWEKKIGFFLFVFYCIGIISSIVNHYQKFFYSALSGIFSLKAFIAYFGMRALCEIYGTSKKAQKRLLYELTGCLVISAAVLFVDQFIPMFTRMGMRFGFPSTSYIFVSHTDVCCYGVLSILMIIYLRHNLRRSPVNYLIIILAFYIVIRGGRFKAVGFLGLFIFLELLLPFIKNFKIRYALLGIPIVWAIAGDQIIYYFGNLNSARGILYSIGLKIAKDFFPFGSGFATFGTDFSRRFYSSIYSTYGISDLFGFSKDNAGYVADTMWSGIIAETGVIGSLAYIMGFAEMFFMISKQVFDKTSKMLMFAVLIYGLFESVGDSIFMSQRGVVLMVIFAYMFSINAEKCNVFRA